MSGRRLSLQQLKNMKPEDLYIENPNLDSMWRDHLLWILDNHPEMCLSLFQKDRRQLKRLLLKVVQKASLQEIILHREKNLQSDQIKEVVYEKIVAPSDSLRDPPKPLNDKVRLQILAWSDELDLKDSDSI